MTNSEAKAWKKLSTPPKTKSQLELQALNAQLLTMLTHQLKMAYLENSKYRVTMINSILLNYVKELPDDFYD